MINIRSLHANLPLLTDYIIEYKPDILALTETWLTENDSNCIYEFLTLNYNFKYITRPDSRFGGVGIIFKDTYKLNKFEKHTLAYSDCLVSNIKINNNTDLNLIVIYRPPSNNYVSFINNLYELLSSLPSNNTIIMGDFNFKVNQHISSSISLTDMLASSNFIQHITTPTHSSGNTLDLVISSSKSNLIIQIKPITHLLTDHFTISLTINIPVIKQLKRHINYRNISKIDLCRFKFDLKSSMNNQFVSITNFNNVLLYLLDKHAPSKVKYINDNKIHWFNETNLKAKKEMRKYERLYKISKSDSSFDSYIISRKYFKKSILIAKKEYYHNKFIEIKNNTHLIYKTANNILGRKPKATLPDLQSDKLSNMFADFFIQKIKKIRNSITNSTIYYNHISTHTTNLNDNINPISCSLSIFISPSTSKIARLLQCLKTSSPNDPIPLILMKVLATTLSSYICDIISSSLNNSFVHPDLKHAIISPIIKKHNIDYNILSNYRPISQLTIIAKLLEKVVYQQLINYIETNDLLDIYQSAYRPFHSTETAIINVLDNVMLMLDDNYPVQMLMLDLSAAFDTLDHTIMKNRLINIGVCNSALDWFMSYLKDRTFSVKTNNSISSTRMLTTGVPQGSVLGLILFLIYIKPLSDIICTFPEIKYHLYADDILLYVPLSRFSSKNSNVLTRCSNAIHHWLTTNNLLLNTSKSELLNIPTGYQFPTVSIDDTIIIPSDKITYLGVIFDRNLTFKSHIVEVCRKSNYDLYNIRRARKFISKDITLMLITSLVMSRFDYCSSIYHGLPNNLMMNISRIIRMSTRIIYRQRLSDYTSVSKRMIDCRIFNIQQKSIDRILCIIHKTLVNKMPRYLHATLKYNTPSTRLRSSNDKLVLVYHKSKLIRTSNRAFSCSSPMLWNSIPLHIRSIHSTHKFKNVLKSYILSTN